MIDGWRTIEPAHHHDWALVHYKNLGKGKLVYDGSSSGWRYPPRCSMFRASIELPRLLPITTCPLRILFDSDNLQR